MHILCHALNMIGEEAYVLQECTDPSLRAPTLTEQIQEKHFQAGLNPIIVYPEIVKDNPLKARAVARFLLNVPGFLTNDRPNWDKSDIVFTFAEHLTPSGLEAHLLELPLVNTDIYNTKGVVKKKRKGTLVFINRFLQRGGTLLPITENSTEISYRVGLRTPEELAALYKGAELMYTYEPSTACYEAIMCGCPVVYIKNDLMLPTQFYDHMETLGSCWSTSPDDIERAKNTVTGAQSAYKKKTSRFWQQLKKFVSLTQERSKTSSPGADIPPLELFKTHKQRTDSSDTYAIWRTRQSMQEIDAEVLAERMVKQWTTRPGLHLLMALHAGEEHLLADTLDSLAVQLYPEWLLTVVSVLPKPEGLDEVPNLQWLSLREEVHIDYVIDEMAAASPGTWLARIEPGLCLEPQSLQVFADYINAHTDWQLIYCDEDTQEIDGSYNHPLFKPDLNLDLLRSQAYFGCCVFVAKSAFLAAGRYGSFSGAENYDLSLRIIDHYGPSVIGHVDQMLAHLPRASMRAMNPEAEKKALTEHLTRSGLDAQIFDGPLFGTRRIEYLWPHHPLVSIIIPIRDREEYLRPLINSMRELTQYPNYEIIIVDNDSSDPDTLRYLTSLTTSTDTTAPSVRVIPCPGEFNWSASANAGADAAHGDYLLFLDNDMHVVQEAWLSRLMGIAQRPDVAIVAPRLSYPETGKIQQGGLILGLGGSISTPWDKEQGLTDPGYMGRALCDQNLSAASGSALLIKRSVLLELGGFDAEHFPLVHGAVDLCLRTTRLGYRIVWTPHSVLVHYGSISIQARQRKVENRLADWLLVKKSQDTLLDRWLPQLAHDPAYNRNLSLVDAYKPEHLSPIDWDPNFHDRPRILAIPVPGGAGEYRLRAPLRVIAQTGLAQTMICEPINRNTMRILTPIEVTRAAPDVIVIHQPISDAQIDSIEGYAHHLPKIRRILTMDDLIIDLPKKHPMYKSGYKDGKQRLRKNLSHMDRLVVSTQPLADLCADMIDDIRVMPNCLEWSLWQDAVPMRLPRKKPRVGWAGAQQHQGDLELIYPVVEALADEVDWIFMGMCPDELKPFVRESHGFERDFQAYPKALARLDLDLAIAPLEINAFNEAKSNLRLLEYGIMGWPVICTDIYPYQNAPVTRLPNTPDKWIATIREQLADPDALKEAGQALKDWVLNKFILERHVESWFAAYVT